MSKPIILSGRFHAGADFECGENVVVDVAEEVVLGDRCTLAANSYISGRSVKVGDDFFGYRWDHPHWQCPGMGFTGVVGRWLEVGRGRRDEEHAVLTVGSRNTWHDNRIDLSAPVTVGDDVGLSPEVTISTHHYWQSVLEGYPQRCDGVEIGNGVIVGYRSTVVAGARIGDNAVIGAQSVVSGTVLGGKVWGGNPLRMLREDIKPYPSNIKAMLLKQFVEEWLKTLAWRKQPLPAGYTVVAEYPHIALYGGIVDVEQRTLAGIKENSHTDDLRWFLFKKGIRIFTKRRFKALEKL